MGKSNKSKRFVKQGKDSVASHDQRFPYRMTLAEAEKNRSELENSLGGF